MRDTKTGDDKRRDHKGLPHTSRLELVHGTGTANATVARHQLGMIRAPPSMRSTCPEMYAPPSVTRNSTALATSSGQP